MVEVSSSGTRKSQLKNKWPELRTSNPHSHKMTTSRPNSYNDIKKGSKIDFLTVLMIFVILSEDIVEL